MQEKKEMILVYQRGFLKGFLKAAFVSYLFYRSILILFVLGIGVGIYGVFSEKKLYIQKKREEITLQFREGLQGIASALSVGYSIENAFGEAKKDLQLLYGAESILAREFTWIEAQIRLNQPVETILYLFAQKWNAEDITNFAQVFQTAKRTGGDLIAITKATAEKISGKIEVQREIQTMIAGKKMEGKIMNMIPLGMILYFWICSPGFLDCMYVSSGRLVMTVLMITYVVAYKWSNKISEIQI